MALPSLIRKHSPAAQAGLPGRLTEALRLVDKLARRAPVTYDHLR